MDILFICHRIPYPPNKGDKIRSFNEIKHLSETHDIDLACLADNPDDLRYKSDLETLCRRVHVEPLKHRRAKIKGAFSLLAGATVSTAYFYNRKLQQVVNSWLEKFSYGAIIFFSSPMAEYYFRSSFQGASPKLIMDFCDVDSDKWRQYSEKSRIPMSLVYSLEFKRLLAYEKKVSQSFDHSIFVSRKEADLFQELAPGAGNITVIPNGVDFDYFSPCDSPASDSPADTKHFKLMFAGAMDYHANIDGVIWFCNEIFPVLRKNNNGLQFDIVGSNPAPSVTHLAGSNGVNVTGFVEDIRPYYSEADLCVIPLRLARGVQNKVLEAMAMGKAIVTTSAAVQGISAIDGVHVAIADTSPEFISTVSDLLADNTKRKHLGSNARDLVTNEYNWKSSMRKLEKMVG